MKHRISKPTEITTNKQSVGEQLRYAAAALALLLFFSSLLFGQDLYVSSSNGNIVEYNGTTGAFVRLYVSAANTYAPHNPEGLCFGPDHNLYVSDIQQQQILRYDHSTGAPVPSGVNTGATFVTAPSGGMIPYGLTFDVNGNLYVADGTTVGGISKYNGTTGALISHFIPNTPAINACGIAFGGPAGDLYATSQMNNTIHRYDRSSGAHVGTLPFATDPDPSPGPHYDLTFDKDGNLYVTSFVHNNVLRFDINGLPYPSSGNTGASFVAPQAGGLKGPIGLAFGPGGYLYVSSAQTGKILRFNGTTGAYDRDFASGSGLASPSYIAFGPASNGNTANATQGSCINFNDGTKDLCITQNLIVSFSQPGPSGGASDKFLKLKDDQNESFITLPNTFFGDWRVTPNCIRTLSFDIELLDDGLPNNPYTSYSIGFKVAGGNYTASYTSPTVQMSELIGPYPGWHHICAPISGGSIPPGWTMTSGTAANWSTMISNISSVTIGFDPSSFQTEIYGIDNICIDISCSPDPCSPGN